ncbi:hypothetical protein BX666DRAFT_1252376 [Dichotomocladium elegans]|nr:hypothetical protein BX666DRAFT_1252376 [Dichotomocladium elegans]
MPNEDNDQHILLGAQDDTVSSSSSSVSSSGAVRKHDDKDSALPRRQASLDNDRGGGDDDDDDADMGRDNEQRRLLEDSDSTAEQRHQEENGGERGHSYELQIQEPTSSILESASTRVKSGMKKKKEDDCFADSICTKPRNAWRCPLFAAFFVLFFLLFKVVMLASFPGDENQREPDMLFYNGSEYFDPTVILISLDGFRNEYLLRNQTPNLVKLGKHLRLE